MTAPQYFKTKQQPEGLIILLNQALSDTITLRLMAKQAHWNVRGHNFIALHGLFDMAANTIDGYADLLAERIAQLGDSAKGTLEEVGMGTNLSPYLTGL